MRPLHLRRAVAALAAGVAALPAAAGQPSENQHWTQSHRLDALLGLVDSRIAEVSFTGDPGAQLEATLPLDDHPCTLVLAPVDVRAAGYQLLVQQADGSIVAAPGAAAPTRTYRGSVRELPGSRVAAALTDEGLLARVILANDEQYWVEPLAPILPLLEGGEHVVHRGRDAASSGGWCATGDLGVGAAPPEAPPFAAAGAPAMAAGSDGLWVAELACDADHEFFQIHGSVAAVEQHIEAVINAVNIVYERDAAITHEITTIIVRTSATDPYSGTDSIDLLEQMQDHWQQHHGDLQRDVAQLFTGRNLDGSVIGIGFMQVICTGAAYSLVEGDCCSFACATDLAAHELGHNWGADHCACGTHTMNAFLQCANQLHPAMSVPEIVAHRDSRWCLEVVGAGSVEAPIVAMDIWRGTLIQGDQLSLGATDGVHVRLDAELTGARHRTELRVRCMSPVTAASRIDVTTELGADSELVRSSIFIRNYRTERWNRLETYIEPMGDTVRYYLDIDMPTDYIRESDGLVHLRILGRRVIGGYVHRMDHVEVTVRP